MAGAIVQTVGLDSNASSTTIASGSFGSNVTANNYLYIVTTSDAADTVTISKNSGTATIGTVTEIASVTEAGVLDEMTHFWCQVTGSGSLDILATFGSAQTARGIWVAEVSGVNAVDVTDIKTDTGNNPSPNPSLSVTVTTQPAFGISVMVDYQGGSPAVGTGWTSGGSFWGVARNGFYQTKAISSTGSLTSNFVNAGLSRANASLIVFTDGSLGPTITSQPTSQTIYDGESANYSVTATGNGTLSYQWKRNGSNVGTNSSSYNTGVMSTANNGQTVLVDVTDNDGTVSSNTVYLYVIGAARGAWIRA